MSLKNNSKHSLYKLNLADQVGLVGGLIYNKKHGK